MKQNLTLGGVEHTECRLFVFFPCHRFIGVIDTRQHFTKTWNSHTHFHDVCANVLSISLALVLLDRLLVSPPL